MGTGPIGGGIFPNLMDLLGRSYSPGAELDVGLPGGVGRSEMSYFASFLQAFCRMSE